MKLLMLGAGLISIANFATAGGGKDEERKVEWADYSKILPGFKTTLAARDGYFCGRCGTEHQVGYACPIPYLIKSHEKTSYLSPDEVCGVYDINEKILIFRAEDCLKRKRCKDLDKSNVISPEGFDLKHLVEWFSEKLLSSEYDSGDVFLPEDIENWVLEYLKQRYQNNHLLRIQGLSLRFQRAYSTIEKTIKNKEEAVNVLQVFQKALDAIAHNHVFDNLKPKALSYYDSTKLVNTLFAMGVDFVHASIVAFDDKKASEVFCSVINDLCHRLEQKIQQEASPKLHSELEEQQKPGSQER